VDFIGLIVLELMVKYSLVIVVAIYMLMLLRTLVRVEKWRKTREIYYMKVLKYY